MQYFAYFYATSKKERKRDVKLHKQIILRERDLIIIIFLLSGSQRKKNVKKNSKKENELSKFNFSSCFFNFYLKKRKT